MIGLVRLGNALGALGIASVLLIGFGLQFGLNELPCPLCMLQRVAFVLCGFGFILNLRFGSQPLHYGLTLLGALFGLAASGRQVLLHIVPGTGAYGSPILGLHFYSWALVLFIAVVLGTAFLLILSGGGRLEHDRFDSRIADRFAGFYKFAAYMLILATLANAVASFVQCGPLECPDNPTSYWLLQLRF
ncbi:MAG: disulfide bond formation protein B [Reyranellales bacterium]